MFPLKSKLFIVLLGLGLAACSGPEIEITDEDIDRIAPDLNQISDQSCPIVRLRPGTQSVRRYAPGRELDPQGVRYQATISEGVRECTITTETIAMNVGVGGRIVFGPEGEPGQTLSLPLRVAVVKGSTAVFSQLQPVSVVTNPGETSRPWSSVQRDIVVTREPGDNVEDYQIIVGFDDGS
ncbi:MAG: hypothetical protein AAF619_02115 [Pseudomonadota bacterium]